MNKRNLNRLAALIGAAYLAAPAFGQPSTAADAIYVGGDIVTLDVPSRVLRVEISDAEMAKRKAAWVAPKPHYPRGYGAIFAKHVTQANEGCDFDFLTAEGTIPEPEIH